ESDKVEQVKPNDETDANKSEQEKPTVKDGHFATLEPGKNHALCGITSSDTNKPLNGANDKESIKPYCMRFAVYTPFFYFPHQSPWKNKDKYTDPDPFVFNRHRNFAIFGVVEPNLGEQVGVLNFGWQNLDKDLKTLVSAEDPLEALRQQLDYFERWYYETVDKEKKFTGLKVLLAQTSPQRARVLSARFPGFQVVVSAADQDQRTNETEFSTIWSHEKRAGSFLAVPSPVFDTNKQAVTARFGLVDALPNGGSWRLSSSVNEASTDESGTVAVEPASEGATDKLTLVSPQTAEPTKFRRLVDLALTRCARTGTERDDFAKLKTPEALKWLTLCAIREKFSADVALVQKRDLFDQQSIADENDETKTQEILDRAIWKGDLLTLVYVPGKALKAALQQSDKFVSDESAALLLVDEKGRQLEKLGISSHSVTKENLINEAPIDDNKIYAVATTDYIAAGDTGYPMLAKEALNPKTYPGGFPNELYTISGVVCRKLFTDSDAAEKNCLEPINRIKYLDESVAQQAKPLPQPSRVKRFWHSSPFKWPASSEPASSASALLEQQVQRRPIVMWSLRNIGFGYSSVLSSRTDAEIREKYTGVSPASISTQETKARTFLLDTRLSRTSHREEFFLAMGIDYKETTTGDGSIDTHPSVVQANNRMTWDAAFVHGIKGGRAPLRLGMIFTFHVETPFDRPFVLFNLSTKDAAGLKDQLEVSQGRSWLLLPRAGLRWMNGTNTFELGVQGGWEMDALRGYRFNTLGGPVECLPNPAKTFATCVAEKSDPTTGGLITKDSEGSAILANPRRAGFYGKGGLSIPIFSVMKYEPSYEGDVFINFSGDTSTDTKWRHILKQNLKLSVLPNLSVGPTWQVLWYRNKNAEHSYLIQHQVTMEVSFGFDLFNRREKRVQFKRKQ
ncbi:MAG TPA: 5'-nucleotidase C-terminal domain-containing protein, partial [Pyrinomonadaceae bacterium]|nr:5'-nucleotidase C-terminal domain-containing protein [Pyrinomonadaceae bacterium]